MAYIQLEKGESIAKRRVIGVFDIETEGVDPLARIDIETASLSEHTLALMRRKESEKGVVSLSSDLPKSFLLSDDLYGDRIYLSGLSPESIKRRWDNTLFDTGSPDCPEERKSENWKK